MACQQTLMKEEQNYNFCVQAVLGRLGISQEVFAKTEQSIINDQSM